jgi:hypothetical protein
VKKILFILVTIFALGYAYPQKSIFGTWDYIGKSDDFKYNTIVFKSDSTFNQIIHLDESFDQDTLIFEGRYTIRQDILEVIYKDSDERVKYRVKKLTRKKLILLFNNEQEKFRFKKRNEVSSQK